MELNWRTGFIDHPMGKGEIALDVIYSQSELRPVAYTELRLHPHLPSYRIVLNKKIVCDCPTAEARDAAFRLMTFQVPTSTP